MFIVFVVIIIIIMYFYCCHHYYKDYHFAILNAVDMREVDARARSTCGRRPRSARLTERKIRAVDVSAAWDKRGGGCDVTLLGRGPRT